MEKTSNLSLYVLRFTDRPIIKIGYTKKLPKRIEIFRKEFKEQFTLTNSYLIGCYSAARIIALEKDLLANTEQFPIPEEFVNQFRTKDGFVDGYRELRHSDALDLVLRLIHTKNDITEGMFYFFEGISLERNLKAEFPECIFNEAGETEYKSLEVCAPLIKCIRKSLTDQFKDLSDEELVNIALHSYIQDNNLDLASTTDSVYKRSKRHHALEYPNGWHWRKPKILSTVTRPELKLE